MFSQLSSREAFVVLVGAVYLEFGSISPGNRGSQVLSERSCTAALWDLERTVWNPFSSGPLEGVGLDGAGTSERSIIFLFLRWPFPILDE